LRSRLRTSTSPPMISSQQTRKWLFRTRRRNSRRVPAWGGIDRVLVRYRHRVVLSARERSNSGILAASQQIPVRAATRFAPLGQLHRSPAIMPNNRTMRHDTPSSTDVSSCARTPQLSDNSEVTIDVES
jgi:hypothetical protein